MCQDQLSKLDLLFLKHVFYCYGSLSPQAPGQGERRILKVSTPMMAAVCQRGVPITGPSSLHRGWTPITRAIAQNTHSCSSKRENAMDWFSVVHEDTTPSLAAKEATNQSSSTGFEQWLGSQTTVLSQGLS